jgi:hypothetical protein
MKFSWMRGDKVSFNRFPAFEVVLADRALPGPATPIKSSVSQN